MCGQVSEPTGEAKNLRRKHITHEDIDWTIYNKFLEDTVTCRCLMRFRTHTQFKGSRSGLCHGAIVTRKPCPGCGRHDRVMAVRAVIALWVVPIP